MPLKRIMTVYGTRPEAIKVAPIIRAIEASEHFESVVVVTGQHREMLKQVNQIFDIRPDADLEVMSKYQTLNGVLAKVIRGMEKIYERYQPDAVLVQGDTSSVMGAALAAFNRKIPVVHIEAGLRSGDIASPFPEEANRRITSQIASLHLAPTKRAMKNLRREKISRKDIVITGNSVIDALLQITEMGTPRYDEKIQRAIESGQRIVVVTSHRRENWGQPLQRISKAVSRLAKEFPDVWFVFPLHRNPLVRATIVPLLESASNVILTDPLDYVEFSHLLRSSYLVLTDSGGVQEEAPSLGKPVLVLRENTERPEAVKIGASLVVGTQEKNIINEVRKLLNDESHYQDMANAGSPYGDGRAAERTIAALERFFEMKTKVEEFKSINGKLPKNQIANSRAS